MSFNHLKTPLNCYYEVFETKGNEELAQGHVTNKLQH